MAIILAISQLPYVLASCSMATNVSFPGPAQVEWSNAKSGLADDIAAKLVATISRCGTYSHCGKSIVTVVAAGGLHTTEEEFHLELARPARFHSFDPPFEFFCDGSVLVARNTESNSSRRVELGPGNAFDALYETRGGMGVFRPSGPQTLEHGKLDFSFEELYLSKAPAAILKQTFPVLDNPTIVDVDGTRCVRFDAMISLSQDLPPLPGQVWFRNSDGLIRRIRCEFAEAVNVLAHAYGRKPTAEQKVTSWNMMMDVSQIALDPVLDDAVFRYEEMSAG